MKHEQQVEYICIEGRIASRGEYITESMEYRPYEAVTLIDNDGDEVHFSMLSISKRMDAIVYCWTSECQHFDVPTYDSFFEKCRY